MNLSNITINTQSSIKITGSKTLYFDAFRIAEEIHDADIIFITHEHFDHFDIDSIAKIKTEESMIVAPASMKENILSKLDISADNCIFLGANEDAKVNDIMIHTVFAYNNNRPFHEKSCHWLGYVVTMDDVIYYIAGDTDANEDNINVKCDVALVPIGGKYTMDKVQAVEFVASINPKAVIPTHYGEVVGNAADGKDFMELMKNKNSNILVELRL